MNEFKGTPGPWKAGEFDECLGYDCMTAGVRAGPAVLDGRDYGQKPCTEIEAEAKARMLADASLIVAATGLLASNIELAKVVREMCACLSIPLPEATLERSDAAIAKALGGRREVAK